MKMRSLLLAVLLGALSAPQAMAYENYLPLGAGYSPSVDTLPEFSSEAGRVSQQSDIYESELYRIGRTQIEEDSRFRQFFSDKDSNGIESHIDY
jgi:hypothetical protein